MEIKRKQLIDRLEAVGKEFAQYLADMSEEEANASPTPEQWSARHLAIHMRDTEQQVFLLRTERALYDEHSTVGMFVQEEWEREHPSEHEAYEKIIADFRAARRKLIRLLRKASKREWENWVAHPKLGKLSVGLMATFNYSHSLDHLAQLIDLHEKTLLHRLNQASK